MHADGQLGTAALENAGVTAWEEGRRSFKIGAIGLG